MIHTLINLAVIVFIATITIGMIGSFLSHAISILEKLASKNTFIRFIASAIYLFLGVFLAHVIIAAFKSVF